MAARITVLEGNRQPYGGNQWRILYWFAINPLITDGATPPNNIAPQSWAQLPDDAKRYIAEGSADALALNNGSAGFTVVERLQGPTESAAAFQARILADHTAFQTWWIAQYRARFQYSGFGAN